MMNYAEYQLYLGFGAWERRRLMAIKRAEGRCQICNTPALLTIHLRDPARRGMERPADMLAVCDDCAEVIGKIVRAREYARLLKRRPRVATEADA